MVDKKLYLMTGIPIFLVLLISVLIFSFASLSPSAISYSDTVQTKGVVCLGVTRADGTYEDLGCKHNLVYNDGLEMFEESIAFGTNLSIKRISLCNETLNTSADAGCAATVAGQTELFRTYTTCGLDPANGTFGNNGASNGNWSYSATFTNSCAFSLDVNGSRIGSPVMTIARNFSGATFSSVVTLAQNDQLTVNWTLMGSSG